MRDCIAWKPGEGPAEYQGEGLSVLQLFKRFCLRSPHGVGKTGMVAWAILWFALVHDGTDDWKIPITASAWRQLTHFLWPEVRKWARRLRWDLIGREPFDDRFEMQTYGLKMSTGEAFTMASDNPELIEGAHAAKLLYVFDESKIIPPETWNSAEGASSTGDVWWLAVSTPGEPGGRFYDIQTHKAGYEDWHVRHVTLREAIRAGRMSQKWADDRKRQWGEKSAAYQNRVLGEFASSEEDGVIPLSWIEGANERWYAWKELEEMGAFSCVGVDVARSGEDKTVMALRYGRSIDALRSYGKEDTMETTGRVKGILDAHGGRAVVDVIGIGAGVVDRLREMKYMVDAFNASEHTDARDSSGEMGFTNCRAAAWWGLRERLDPDSDTPIALPPDDLLTGDLTAPTWRVMSGGKIQIESKDDIKVRIGRSTDSGDAVAMAFFEGIPTLLDWVGAMKKRQEQQEKSMPTLERMTIGSGLKTTRGPGAPFGGRR